MTNKKVPKLLQKQPNGRYSLKTKTLMKSLIMTKDVSICNKLRISRSLYYQVREGALWASVGVDVNDVKQLGEGYPHTITLQKARVIKSKILLMAHSHTYDEISKVVNLSSCHVGRIIRGKAWRKV